MVQSTPPVRNRHLAREFDRRRIREMLLVAALVIVLLLPLLSYVWYHMEWIRLGYEMQRLRQKRDEQVELSARLRIEKASLESLARVEREARKRLGLVHSTGAVIHMEEDLLDAAGPAASPSVSRLDLPDGQGGASQEHSEGNAPAAAPAGAERRAVLR